ncbi:MAG: SDR family oxidoreductase [Candidatus Bathyarchaeia archaeon]
MKILITGASSLPGFRTVKKCLEKGYDVSAVYHETPIQVEHGNLKKIRLDVRDLESFKRIVFNGKFDVVVHMAALGDVDLCERDRSLAWSTTVEPSIALAKWSFEIQSFLIYLSTDYVFDGERGGYCEYDPPNPVNYYGLVKFAGEVAFRSSNVDCAIVRASSIYGFGPGRKNFAKFLVERLEKGEEVKALIDQYTTPTQARLLGEAIAEIIERKLTGVFHVAGERMSRYEFALKVARTLGLDEKLVKKAEMKDMKWTAKRPRDSSLNSEYTKSILKTDFYSTDNALNVLRREYLEAKKS